MMACCRVNTIAVFPLTDVDKSTEPKRVVRIDDFDYYKESTDTFDQKKEKDEVFIDERQGSGENLVKFVRKNVIGNDVTFDGPFGRKNLTYCDYTASGRSLKCIEDYISKYVCPFYGNTHTTTSIAARQTTRFRDEARDIIKKCVNANNDDVVIYAGSGTTGAIHKLVAVLELKTDSQKAKNSVIFIGPYEHHSNILPWKESGAKIIRIKESRQGLIDLDDLDKKLHSCRDVTGIRVVACSAVSNVTGIITDVDAVARTAHKHGAFVVFDYASGAPYLKMDMNPSSDAYKDAIVCSPHKFVGGPGTPGLLISKRHMFSNLVPDQGGGGTVLYVTRDTYAYLKDIESREEGGTPAIIDSIRCGLVFQMTQAIGPSYIETLEDKMTRRAFATWSKSRSMIILGSHKTRRLPIFSFVTKHVLSGKYIHHNYMSAILNDIFGVQTRGGCACAGPYAEDLLGIAEPLAQNFAKMLEGNDENKNETVVSLKSSLEIMKPGFCRLNLPYFMDEKTVDYVIKAVSIAADEGWKLLPQYVHDPHTGVWKHRSMALYDKDTPYSLSDIDFSKVKVDTKPCKRSKLNIKKSLKDAAGVFEAADRTTYVFEEICDNVDDLVGAEKRSLIWFLQPRKAYRYLPTVARINFGRQRSVVPFTPRRLISRSFFGSGSARKSRSVTS